MSIIKLASEANTCRRHEALEIVPNIRDLLDHISVELAEEYVRLMEAAATSDSAARQEPAPNTTEEDHGQ
jgi:hypothetical protein